MKPLYLRTLRERRGWTQEQLEQISHVAQNSISKLERNPNARPAFPTVAKLARALDVGPLDLRFGPDPHARKPRRKSRVAA
jgi:transcriptional regulator with XRE-family HTH domain